MSSYSDLGESSRLWSLLPRQRQQMGSSHQYSTYLTCLSSKSGFSSSTSHHCDGPTTAILVRSTFNFTPFTFHQYYHLSNNKSNLINLNEGIQDFRSTVHLDLDRGEELFLLIQRRFMQSMWFHISHLYQWIGQWRISTLAQFSRRSVITLVRAIPEWALASICRTSICITSRSWTRARSTPSQNAWQDWKKM
jgi:hypothetical protein